MARILVVEDEESLQLLYQQELEDDGHEVLCARDGKSAVRMALDVTPDVVIMDINLPENMDGIECMTRLLSQDNKLPVKSKRTRTQPGSTCDLSEVPRTYPWRAAKSMDCSPCGTKQYQLIMVA